MADYIYLQSSSYPIDEWRAEINGEFLLLLRLLHYSFVDVAQQNGGFGINRVGFFLSDRMQLHTLAIVNKLWPPVAWNYVIVSPSTKIETGDTRRHVNWPSEQFQRDVDKIFPTGGCILRELGWCFPIIRSCTRGLWRRYKSVAHGCNARTNWWHESVVRQCSRSRDRKRMRERERRIASEF